MARPPKNAEGPSATERMEAAFWDCMKEMPFSEITVRDIVGRAKVNRNSYYYHYESMWDLAQESIEHAKFAALARVLLGYGTADADDDADASAKQAHAGFDHLRVLASENGNQRLLEDAKRAVVGEWLTAFDLDANTLPSTKRSSIDFVFGGLTALLAPGQSENLDAFEETVDGSELLSSSIAMFRGELDPNAAAQDTWSQESHVKMTEERVVIERTVEELVVTEQHVEADSVESEKHQVNEVLAPHEEALGEGSETDFGPVIEEVSSSETEDGSEVASIADPDEQADIQEPSDISDEEADEEPSMPTEQMQEPAEKLSAESLIEQIIKEEMHAELGPESSYSTDGESKQVPEQEMQTEQETENDNEGLSEQEPVNESQPEEDFASTQSVDDVFTTETREESQSFVNSRQEPVNTHESETLPPWESTATEKTDGGAHATEVVFEEHAEDVAVYEATYAEVSELDDGSAPDAFDEQATPVESADDGSDTSQGERAAEPLVEDEPADEPEEDSQLSFDFLF